MEPHRRVSLDTVMTLGDLGGVMISIVASITRDALGAISPIFLIPMTVVSMARIVYKLYAVG